MKIFCGLLCILSSAMLVWADIPPTKNGQKTEDTGLCVGVLLSVAMILIFGRWVLKRTAGTKHE
jgi:hypothetical protein